MSTPTVKKRRSTLNGPIVVDVTVDTRSGLVTTKTTQGKNTEKGLVLSTSSDNANKNNEATTPKNNNPLMDMRGSIHANSSPVHGSAKVINPLGEEDDEEAGDNVEAPVLKHVYR